MHVVGLGGIKLRTRGGGGGRREENTLFLQQNVRKFNYVNYFLKVLSYSIYNMITIPTTSQYLQVKKCTAAMAS